MTGNHNQGPSPQVTRTTAARIPTAAGEFRLVHYRNSVDDKEHLALVMGELAGQADVLTRVHSECLTGDVFGSSRCDCGEQLARAMQLIAAEGRGLIVYLRQEGRGIGLEAKLSAYNLQDQGYDTVDANLLLGHQADEREYWAAAGILADLRVHSVRLLTNNPTKLEHLTVLGVHVTQRMPLTPSVNAENASYLNTKVQRMRHMLELPEVPPTSSTVVKQHAPPHPGDTIDALAATQIAQLHARAEAYYAETGRPFVTVSYAQSLDGSITVTRGTPFAISGPESLMLTHALRAAHDSVLVGIGTMLADNPRLNVRLVEGRNPAAIVVDSHLRTPADARVFGCHEQTWLATTNAPVPANRQATPKGASLIMTAPDRDGRVDLDALMDALGRAGVRSVMVEGGATILSAFLRQGLANYVVVTISPLLLGGLPAMHGIGNHDQTAFPRLTDVTRTEAGDDIILWGALDYPELRNDNAPLQSPTEP